LLIDFNSVIEEIFIISQGVNVFYHKTSLPDSVTSSGQTILLLHGKSFTSQVWQDCGTMVTMAALGHLVVAVDLPGSFLFCCFIFNKLVHWQQRI
jgi:pimeloyl-ACP methyl ester carboxylesterase